MINTTTNTANNTGMVTEKISSLGKIILKGILIFVIAFILSAFITGRMRILTVSGQSMAPSYHDKDVLLATLFSTNGFDRDTVVSAFISEEQEGGGSLSTDRYSKLQLQESLKFLQLTPHPTNVLKRIVGLPGETLQVIDGKLYIDGRLYVPAGQRFADIDSYNHGILIEPVTLGENEYFLLGDNYNVSMDSRMFGPVTKDQIFGIIVEPPFR